MNNKGYSGLRKPVGTNEGDEIVGCVCAEGLDYIMRSGQIMRRGRYHYHAKHRHKDILIDISERGLSVVANDPEVPLCRSAVYQLAASRVGRKRLYQLAMERDERLLRERHLEIIQN